MGNGIIFGIICSPANEVQNMRIEIKNNRKMSVFAGLFLCIALLAFSGCGKKNEEVATEDVKTETSDNEMQEDGTTESNAETDTDTAPENAADKEAIYLDFLNNEEPVYFTWFLDSENSNTSDWRFSEYNGIFRSGSAYVFSDFMEVISNAIEDNFEVREYPRNISYAFTDGGNDGEPELFIKVEGIAESMVDLTDVWCIREIDGKLQVILYAQYGYRTMFSVNDKGYYYYGGSSGAASHSICYGYIDAEGMSHFDYGIDTNDAVWSLYVQDNDTYEAVAEEEGIDDNIEIEQYFLTEYEDDEDYAAFQQASMWNYYELNHNGNRIENNDEIYEDGDPFKIFWDSTGLPLNTDEEIETAIDKKHKEEGLGDSIINASEAGWTPLTDEMLDVVYAWAPEVVATTVLAEPSWEYYYMYDAKTPCTSVSLTEESKTSNDIIDDDDWFNEIEIERPGDRSFDDEHYHYELYGEDEDGLLWYPYMMDISERNGGKVLYTLDFSSYYKPPMIALGDEKFVEEAIHWAVIKDDILYVSTYHNTYASSASQNGYITALDIKENFQVLWRSEPLVCNSHNFVVTDDAIICGYGFTNEPDYVYVLNREDGVKVGTYKVKTGPDWLFLKDDKLYVRCYDTNYVFSVEGL